MARCLELVFAANSTRLNDMMCAKFEREIVKDMHMVTEITRVYQKQRQSHVKGELIVEVQRLHGSIVSMESTVKLNMLQGQDIRKAKALMRMVKETHNRVLKTINFYVRLRDMKRLKHIAKWQRSSIVTFKGVNYLKKNLKDDLLKVLELQKMSD
ncbi:hypothetical protein Tco_0788188 [Tanacetum coccineum]